MCLSLPLIGKANYFECLPKCADEIKQRISEQFWEEKMGILSSIKCLLSTGNIQGGWGVAGFPSNIYLIESLAKLYLHRLASVFDTVPIPDFPSQNWIMPELTLIGNSLHVSHFFFFPLISISFLRRRKRNKGNLHLHYTYMVIFISLDSNYSYVKHDATYL